MPLAEKKITAEQYFEMVNEANELTELIDGEIVALAAPNEKHFDICFSMCSKLSEFIHKNSGECKSFMAPFDVVLDEYNVARPDIFVVCDPNKRDGKRINGAPDIAIEVTSSNRSYDYIKKFELYKNHGVREYWIIDPQYERVMVYRFEKNVPAEIYAFDQNIPVGIWEGRLEIRINDLIS